MLSSISASFHGPLMRGSVREDERSRWRRKKQENDARDVMLCQFRLLVEGGKHVWNKEIKKWLSGEHFIPASRASRAVSVFSPCFCVMSMGLCGSDCLTHHGPLHHDLFFTAIQAPSTGELWIHSIFLHSILDGYILTEVLNQELIISDNHCCVWDV